ncbi:unnamed protein product, partial [Heterosigma akashiwo]
MSNQSGPSPVTTESVAASVASSLIAGFIFHPLDTCKARIQGPEGAIYRNIPQTMVKIVREDGPRALYRGYGAVLWGGTPGNALYFTSYEYFKHKMAQYSGEAHSDETFTHLSA